jgi:hypothetical protein
MKNIGNVKIIMEYVLPNRSSNFPSPVDVAGRG